MIYLFSKEKNAYKNIKRQCLCPDGGILVIKKKLHWIMSHFYNQEKIFFLENQNIQRV